MKSPPKQTFQLNYFALTNTAAESRKKGAHLMKVRNDVPLCLEPIIGPHCVALPQV
jgi:hypothetical protein